MNYYEKMKQDMIKMIERMSEDELYEYTSDLQDAGIDLPPSVLTCNGCRKKYGKDCPDDCRDRFLIYCKEILELQK